MAVNMIGGGTDFEVEELVLSLKKLLIGFAPHIREAGSVEQAEEAIKHMEENDENFHRYDFVKKLRTKIDSSLGNLIDEEIERHSIAPNDATAGQETVVSQITQRILNSQQYGALTHTLQSKVTAACDYLIENFDSEFAPEGSDKSTVGKSKRNKGLIYSDGESSLDSSMNQSDLMFLNPDQFHTILERLDKRKPLETRQDALKKLLQVTSMDLQNCDVWSSMRQKLLDALSDPDEVLWNQSMKFVAKGLSANTPNTRDLFTTLVEFLAMQFQSVNKVNVPKVKTGLDCNKPEMIKLLKGFRLMNDFQQQVSQYWIRYPEKFVEEVIESTLSLLSVYTGSTTGASALVTPVHFVALLDPRANWFIKWMHGHYSRSPLLKIMERHRSVVDNAVRSCLDYAMARKVQMEQTPREEMKTPTRLTGDTKRSIYTGEEVSFLYFVHSLYLVGRLLCFDQGRKFFPVKVKDREEPVTIIRFIVLMIQLVTDSSSRSPPSRMFLEYEPCRLVTEMLKRLCNSETVCQISMCKDDVMAAILSPVSYWLDGSSESGLDAPSETGLLHMADLLSQLASNSCGRRQILHGETGNRFSKSKSSPIHILSEFAKRALSGSLGPDYGRAPSLGVVGNIVFVCRQLYSTSEGLQIMYSYDLHNAIANAWRVASREADRAATPTPSGDGYENPSASANVVLWEDMLRDNLLNMTGTPKGVLLLQLTGAMNECVAYMHSRYARKLQVSKCEKFGYGYMMSQVSATSAGAVALQHTGYLRTLIYTLWGALEVVDDQIVHVPKTWPVNPIDKTVGQTFSSLVYVLSSYEAVYEVFHAVPLPTKDTYTFREIPDSLAALMDRIVLVDTEAKIHSLFNYEQSHVCGLRLMSIITSCLDSLLLLQTQYNFQEVLLQMQKENTLEDSKDIIRDMLSVERNYLLVRTSLVGGPSERKLPARSLVESKSDVYPFPLFSSYPIPKEYIPNIASSSGKQDSELSKFLSNTKKNDYNKQWLEKCRKNFCTILTTKPGHAKGAVLQDLLEKVSTVLSTLPEEAIFPLLEYTGNEAALKNIKLTPLQKLGIETAIRYGTHLKLISGSDAKEKLTALLKKTCLYLKTQQRSCSNSTLSYLQSSTPAHDWFVSTIFLLMHGNGDHAWRFLQRFSSLAASAYVWNTRLHCSTHLPQPLMLSGISPIYSSMCHNVEVILQAEVAHVYYAFKMSGYAPAQICQHWIRQCFWNYLDWQEICHYLCTCIVLGVDYQVYLCVAIFKFLQRPILENMQGKNLLVFLKEEPIVGFKVGEHLEYMQQLESRYRKTILPDMLNIARP